MSEKHEIPRQKEIFYVDSSKVTKRLNGMDDVMHGMALCVECRLYF